MKDRLNLQSEQTCMNVRENERALSHTITEGQIHVVKHAAFNLNVCAGVFVWVMTLWWTLVMVIVRELLRAGESSADPCQHP